MMSSTQFQISQLRQENSLKLQESLLVFIASFFGIALLPQLLVRYVYANEALLETPRALEMIPVALFAVATAYFLYAIVGNFIRYNRIKLLDKNLAESDCCECNDCNCGNDFNHQEIKELDDLVKEVEASMPNTSALSEAMKKDNNSKVSNSNKKKPARKKGSK